MNLTTFYFSGTGNTKYVAKIVHSNLTNNMSFFSIEDKDVNFDEVIRESDFIMLAYPIYGSMLPFIFSDFLTKFKSSFSHKKVITLCTQMLFSGDGGQLPLYELKGNNVKLQHSIHINMPNNISDVSFLPVKPLESYKYKLNKAHKKIDKVTHRIKCGKAVKHGNRFYSRFLGYTLQRLYTKPHQTKLRSQVKICHEHCVLCDKCVATCPTQNLLNKGELIEVHSSCTLCYRCVNLCPKKAISIFSKKGPKKQYILDDYN